MDGKMNASAVILLSVLLLAKDAYCIKCYSCSTKNNEDCWNPAKSKLQTKHCNLTTAKELQLNAKAVDEDFYHSFEIDIEVHDRRMPMNCLKQVTKVGNKELIIRGCQLAPTRDLSICNKVREEATKKALDISHCSLCSSDGCNSGPKISYSEATLCLITFATIFSLRL